MVVESYKIQIDLQVQFIHLTAVKISPALGYITISVNINRHRVLVALLGTFTTNFSFVNNDMLDNLIGALSAYTC